MTKFIEIFLRKIRISVAILLTLFCSQAFSASGGTASSSGGSAAGGGKTDIVAVATTVSSQLNSLATLLGRISYAAGIALAIVSLMKFKAHKDNPQQEPIGKAVTYLAVAGGLLFLPTVMDVASRSLFGANGNAGSNILITTS
ncbi:MAG: type secretion protein IcmD [Francisellaceae bacterium]|nr:type secretion protein IcmD [Francisellaceae bacterium]